MFLCHLAPRGSEAAMLHPDRLELAVVHTPLSFLQLAPRGGERDPMAGSMPRKAGPPHTLIVIMLISRTWTLGGEPCADAPLE